MLRVMPLPARRGSELRAHFLWWPEEKVRGTGPVFPAQGAQKRFFTFPLHLPGCRDVPLPEISCFQELTLHLVGVGPRGGPGSDKTPGSLLGPRRTRPFLLQRRCLHSQRCRLPRQCWMETCALFGFKLGFLTYVATCGLGVATVL